VKTFIEILQTGPWKFSLIIALTREPFSLSSIYSVHLILFINGVKNKF